MYDLNSYFPYNGAYYSFLTLFFSLHQPFRKILSGTPSECQTVSAMLSAVVFFASLYSRHYRPRFGSMLLACK